MKKIFKFLKWTAIVLIGVPVLIYLVWITGNLTNDEITPELSSLLARRVPQLNEKDNAYFDAIGLAAPAEVEPHAWGVSLFAQVVANDKATNDGKSPIPITLEGYPPTFNAVDPPCSNKDPKYSCLKEVAADKTAAGKSLVAEATILKRFDSILDKNYQEPDRQINYQSVFVPTAPEFRAIKLAIVRISLDIANKRDDAALERWGKETTFILHQATNSHGLIDKLVLIAALNRYQRLLADYISLHPREAQTRAKHILTLLEPFNKKAVTLQPAFEYEAIATTRSMLALQEITGVIYDDDSSVGRKIIEKLSMPFFDRKATANEMAKRQLEWSRITALEGDSYRAGIAKLTDEPLDPMSVLLSYHNPVGKVLAQVGSPDLSSYCFRSDNVIANKKLLAFAVGLISRKVTSSEQVLKEIKANQASLEHPFTGELPVWDANKRTLAYVIPKQIKIPNLVPLVIKL